MGLLTAQVRRPLMQPTQPSLSTQHPPRFHPLRAAGFDAPIRQVVARVARSPLSLELTLKASQLAQRVLQWAPVPEHRAGRECRQSRQPGVHAHGSVGPTGAAPLEDARLGVRPPLATKGGEAPPPAGPAALAEVLQRQPQRLETALVR